MEQQNDAPDRRAVRVIPGAESACPGAFREDVMDVAKRIYLLDDDVEICELLQEYLTGNGLQVRTAQSSDAFFALWQEAPADLVVLDIMLPGDDGFAVLRRESSRVPAIFLSALDGSTDRIVGLELGADDYLGKPFEPRELLARIRTVLRRSGESEPAPRGGILRFASWRLDTTARHLLTEDEVITPLSGAEYRLLCIFLQHPRQVLSRDTLLEMTQGRNAQPYDRSIDVLISRLRSRLRDGGRYGTLIKTVRGEGYVLASDVLREDASPQDAA